MASQGPVSDWPVSHGWRDCGSLDLHCILSFTLATGSRSAWFLAGAGCMTQFSQGLPSHGSGCRPSRGNWHTSQRGQTAAHPRRLWRPLEGAVTRSQWAQARARGNLGHRSASCSISGFWWAFQGPGFMASASCHLTFTHTSLAELSAPSGACWKGFRSWEEGRGRQRRSLLSSPFCCGKERG